jgi:hypothetical protein
VDRLDTARTLTARPRVGGVADQPAQPAFRGRREPELIEHGERPRRRDELEREYGTTVSRALEEEVRAGVRRLGLGP